MIITIKKQFIITGIMFSLTGICSAQTETNVPKDSLPSSVKEHLHSKYHDYSVANIIKTTDKSGTVTYKLEAKRAKNSNENIIYNLVYDTQGKLINKKKDKEIFYDGTEKPKSTPSKSNDGHSGHQH